MTDVTRSADGTPLCPIHMMHPMSESSLILPEDRKSIEDNGLPFPPAKIWRCVFAFTAPEYCHYTVFES